MQDFFKGVLVAFIAEILLEVTSFFVFTYKRQVLLFFRGLTSVMMGILVLLLFLLFSIGRPPIPAIVVLVIIVFVVFKCLQKANQVISLELEKMKSGKEESDGD